MSELESMFSKFTLGELAAKAGISLVTLLERVGFFDGSIRAKRAPQAGLDLRSAGFDPFRKGQRLQAHRRAVIDTVQEGERLKAHKANRQIGNLASQAEREKLDAAIMSALRSSSEPLTIAVIRAKLPWASITRDQLGRAMLRLRDASKITATGNTQARVYAPDPRARKGS